MTPNKPIWVTKIIKKRQRLERQYRKENQRHRDEEEKIRMKFKTLRSECGHWGMQGFNFCSWCGYCLNIDP